jgi:membrane fusion protein (multidrug efflux system)
MFAMCPAILLLALTSCGGEGGGAKASHSPPLVSATPVVTMRFVDRVEAVGTARAREQVTLSAPVTERIVRINFEDGGYVRAGQVIAELAQGQEAAQLAEARGRAREADQQLRRLQSLKKSGFATNASVDAQLALASTARAQAAEANASIGDRVVRAPFGGWASLRMISAGAVVSAGTPIATISDISEIKLDLPVPETLLSTLASGQSIEARAAAFPAESFRGRIATIDPVVDPATRSVMVRAILPNPDGRLKPGMLVTVTIESAPRVARAVPELAVVSQGDNRYVFVVGPGSKAQRVAVKTGIRDRGMIELVDGLKPGQKVISDGVVKVRDGGEVRLAARSGVQTADRRRP